MSKPRIFNEEEGKLALFTTTNNFFTLSPPFFASPHFYCFPQPPPPPPHFYCFPSTTTTFFEMVINDSKIGLNCACGIAVTKPSANTVVKYRHRQGFLRKTGNDEFRNSDKKHTFPSPTLISGNWLSPLWRTRISALLRRRY